MDIANIHCRAYGCLNARKDETDMENVMLRKQIAILIDCVNRCLYGHVLDKEGNRDNDGYMGFPNHDDIKNCLQTTLVQVKQQRDYYNPKLDRLAAITEKHHKQMSKLCQPNKKNSD